jgi:uncharacterized protein (TIGR02996 family)
VYADPAADGPRRVYADWLLERADPRGAFVALQLDAALGALSPAGRAEAAALQRAHQRAWLAPIWPALAKGRRPYGPIVFERGFLAEATVAMPRRGTLDLWERPEWATVRVLRGDFPLTETMLSLEEVALPLHRLEEPVPAGLPGLRRVVLSGSVWDLRGAPALGEVEAAGAVEVVLAFEGATRAVWTRGPSGRLDQVEVTAEGLPALQRIVGAVRRRPPAVLTVVGPPDVLPAMAEAAAGAAATVRSRPA